MNETKRKTSDPDSLPGAVSSTDPVSIPRPKRAVTRGRNFIAESAAEEQERSDLEAAIRASVQDRQVTTLAEEEEESSDDDVPLSVLMTRKRKAPSDMSLFEMSTQKPAKKKPAPPKKRPAPPKKMTAKTTTKKK